MDKRACGWQVNLCDLSLTRAILSALEVVLSRKRAIQMSCLQLQLLQRSSRGLARVESSGIVFSYYG